MSETPTAAPSPKIRLEDLLLLMDGKPIESPRTRQDAVLLLALAIYVQDIELAYKTATGELRKVLRGDVVLDDETLLIQNGGAQPESVRGIVANLASVRAGRRESERRARHNADPAFRAQKERERQAHERAGEESTRHLREDYVP